MAPRIRKPKRPSPVIGGQGLPSTAKHPFYQELNLLLEEARLRSVYVEGLSRPYYAAVGHPGALTGGLLPHALRRLFRGN